jgi:pyrroloquinoline quinone biosynthesis protein D
MAGAEAAHFGQDFVLLDPDGTMLRGLNPTARAVWEACDGSTPAHELARAVAERFHAPLERVLPDVLQFLGQLARGGLLEDAAAAPGASP